LDRAFAYPAGLSRRNFIKLIELKGLSMAESTFAERAKLNTTMSATQKNRALNDHFRKTGEGGVVTLSMGLHKLGQAEVANVMRQLAGQAGDESTEDESEHDMGEIQVGNRTVSWEINCYNKELDDISADSTNPQQTTRFLTLMLSTEF
jgi:hypothetical protein